MKYVINMNNKKIIITSTPTGENNFYKEMMKEEKENSTYKDIKYIKKLLPDYTCEWRKDGTHCYSEIGIEDEEKWNYIFLAIKKYFGDRFYEIFHQTSTNHHKFTIYHD